MIGQKAIGCTLGAISCFLLIAAISNADWATSEGWREGLFVHCPKTGSALPLPFYQPYEMAGQKSGCYSRVKTNFETQEVEKDKDGNMIEYTPGYAKTTFALLLISVFVAVAGTALTGLGLKSEDREKNIKYNKFAICFFAIAFLLLLVASIIYPINFTADQQKANVQYDGCKVTWDEKVCTKDTPTLDEDWPMNDTNSDGIPDLWQTRVGEAREFGYGFCYGVTVLSDIFILITIVLLILDHFNPEPEKEENEGEERDA